MAEEDRTKRTHVVGVQSRKDKFFVIFSDGSECTWDAWVASKARWHLD